MARTETKDSFVIKANEKHSDFYDYSKIEYVNQSTKVEIICPIHGSFWRTPTYHLQGGGCPECAKLRVANYWTPERRAEASARMSSDEVLEKRKQTNRDRYGSDSWAGSQFAKEQQANGEGPWSESARQKAATTCEERFGAKTWAESDIGRKTAREACASDEVRHKMSVVASSPEVREKVRQTSIERYGAEHWAKSEEGRAKLHEMFSSDEERMKRRDRMLSDEIRQKIQQTSMERYGVPYYWQSEEGRSRLKVLLNSDAVVEKTKRTNVGRYGAESWAGSSFGRERLASKDVRDKVADTCMRRYGAETWAQSDEGRAVLSSDAVLDKIHMTKMANHSYGISRPEQELYHMLCDTFGENDICRQYKSERYPFRCDFYVKSLDLFIELNAFWMHGGHWFDANDTDDCEQLQFWLSSDKPMYERAVYIWANNDIAKRRCAEKMNLRYVVFWNNDLTDAVEWFESGCPIRKDWQ